MTAEFVSFVSQLPNALALAGAFLVAGFLVTRLPFGEYPVARFLAQLASFAVWLARHLSGFCSA